jgi:hypothetical protein
MSSHKTHTYDVEDCDDDYYDKYDKYDDFSIHQNVKSNESSNKKQKVNVYSSKHVRNYIKRYNK